jgi:hypothetical protein
VTCALFHRLRRVLCVYSDEKFGRLFKTQTTSVRRQNSLPVVRFERAPAADGNEEAATLEKASALARLALITVIDTHCATALRPLLRNVGRITESRAYLAARTATDEALCAFNRQYERENPAVYNAYMEAWDAAEKVTEAAIDAHCTANVALVVALSIQEALDAAAAAPVPDPAQVQATSAPLDLSAWLKQRLDGTAFEDLLEAFGVAAAGLYQSPDVPLQGGPERKAFLARYSLTGTALEHLVLAFGAQCYAEGQMGAQTRRKA